MSPDHSELAYRLGQGRAELSWLQIAAGAFQALVVLAERPMQGHSEQFVMQLRPAEEVNLFRSRLDQREIPACETIPRNPRESQLPAGLLH